MKKPKSNAKLKKELDMWFSRYIRLKYADDNGICTCYTCCYRNHWKKMHCGHLVSRYYLATRNDERNCRVQCPTCNLYRNGMIPDFSQKLEKELGDGITKELYREANKIVKDYPYQEKINHYRKLVEKLQK